MDIGPGELIVVLLVVLLIFGSTRLPALGKSLGEAMREVRHWSDDDRERDGAPASAAPPAPLAPVSVQPTGELGVGRTAPVGVEDGRERGDAVDEARPGSNDDGIGVDGPHLGASR